jgi:hypothetical protein
VAISPYQSPILRPAAPPAGTHLISV